MERTIKLDPKMRSAIITAITAFGKRMAELRKKNPEKYTKKKRGPAGGAVKE